MIRPHDPFPRTRRTGAFERRVAAALHALIAVDAPLVVACSGGPDSVATLIAVARAHRGEVVAAWFDHAMRPAAEVAREGDVVRRVARDLGIPVVEGRAATPPRGEAGARMARYRWLARAAAKASAAACVTGHTRDDQAETVLLRLVRGAGARGAAGMAADAPWPVVTPSALALRLLRPLLDSSRTEVEAYLAALGVEAAQDPSNESREYARNRIRHDVLPVLAEVNSEAVAHLAAFATREREDDAALSAWAGEWLDQHAQRSEAAVVLPRKALLALPAAVRHRVLALAGERLGVGLSGAHLEGLGRLAGSAGGRQTLPGATAESRGTVVVMRRNA